MSAAYQQFDFTNVTNVERINYGNIDGNSPVNSFIIHNVKDL